jgi:hypothetical protein
MKTETNAAYFTGFFRRTFKRLQVTGLPLAEVLLLDEEARKLSPETLALAMAHACERALAIQKGLMVIDEGLDRGAFHLHTDSNGVWFMPQSRKKGPVCIYATYGVSHWHAKMAYVLAHMTLPIPMDDWLREYR